MSLDYLNEDCLRLIFRDLSLPDLFSLGKTSKFFKHFANAELDRQISKKIVIFKFQNPSSYSKDFTEFYDRIFIETAENAIKVLKNYGHFIKNLAIECPVSVTEVYDLINFHSDSIVQLHLSDVFSFTKNITKPFKNVQKLELEGQFLSFKNNFLNFSELFPQLRSLTLSKINPVIVNREIMDELIVELPLLSHLYVSINTLNKYNMASTWPGFAEEMITKNPQIQSLGLKEPTLEVLKTASDKLKNLEHLEIIGARDLSHVIHFEQVKNFEYIENRNLAINMTFSDKLEELTVVVNHVSNFIDFVEKQRSLKKVTCTKDFGFPDVDVLLLTKVNLSASEFHFNAKDDVKDETIVQFIQSQNQLDNLSLKINTSIKSVKQRISTLKQQIGNEWSLHNKGCNIIFYKTHSMLN